MNCNDKHTINPETGKMIKVESEISKRLAVKYYIFGDQFTDQVIPDPRVYPTSKQKDNRIPGKRVGDPAGIKRYIIVGSKSLNE